MGGCLTATGLKFNVFIRDRNNCPHPSQVGDVIRLHRFRVNTFNDRPQCVATSGFSFLIFNVDDDGATPYQTYPSDRFTWTDADKSRLAALKQWSRMQFRHQAAGENLDRRGPHLTLKTSIGSIDDSLGSCIPRNTWTSWQEWWT